jgi:hypothetical protein
MKQKEVVKDGYGLVLWLSIAGLLAALVVSIYYYRQGFGTTLSSDPNYWSAFGTYFGGIFGPLVSFVTLIAILKTIKLQSTLLETQNHEFSVMQEIQMKTLASQQELADRSLKDAERQEIEACRLSLLAMLDRYIDQAQKRLEATIMRMDRLAEWVLDGKANNRGQDLNDIADIVTGIRRQIGDLNLMLVDLNFNSYSSTVDMRNYYSAEIQKVFNKDTLSTKQYREQSPSGGDTA